MAKEAEGYFKETARALGWAWHKYGDVRYCPHCHGVLPKSETMPDFCLITLPILVECKNSNSTGRWEWKSDIGPEGKRTIQRERLNPDGWLYIVIGSGRVPKEKGAWLIPWQAWLKIEEALLLGKQASLPFKGSQRLIGAVTLFSGFELVWEKGKFLIPNEHIFWETYVKALDRQLVLGKGFDDDKR